MKPTTSAATPRGSPAPALPPSSGATRRQRKAALPLGDVTNLLLPGTPTPIKPRRTGGRRPLPAPSDASAASSTCSSTASVTLAPKPSSSATASVTPAPKPSSAATPSVTPPSASVLEEERSAVASPAISTVYATRSRAPEARRTTTRRNTTGTNNKGKEPVAAGTASCPPLGKATRRKTTTAQDTQLISSSAPCHEAKTVTPPPKPSSAAALEVEERSVVASPSISTVYARRRTPDAQGMRRNPTGTNNRGKELVASAGTASCPLLGKATSRKTSMVQDTRPISSSAPCHEAKKKRPSPSTPKLPEDFVKKQRAYFADIDAFELAVEEVSETDLD